MGLLKTQAQIARLESEILDQFGEIDEEQSDKLDELNQQIEKDRDNAFRFLQTKRPKELKDQIKSRINEMKKEIERLEKISGAMENNLHRFLEGKDYYEVKDSDGNVEFYVKPDLSVRRSVNESSIDPDETNYRISFEIPFSKVDEVHSQLTNLGYQYRSDKIIPNVTDLPEDHKAITKNITPKVKFLKRKPK